MPWGSEQKKTEEEEAAAQPAAQICASYLEETRKRETAASWRSDAPRRWSSWTSQDGGGMTELLYSPESPAGGLAPPWDPETWQVSVLLTDPLSGPWRGAPLQPQKQEVRGERDPPPLFGNNFKGRHCNGIFYSHSKICFWNFRNCCNNNDEGVAGVRFIHFCRGQFCEKYSKMLFWGGAVGSNLNGLQSTVLSKFPIIFWNIPVQK